MKRILYIASINTNKEKFDGERIKSTLIYSSLKKYYVVESVNLSNHKVLNTIKLIFKLFFKRKKYSNIYISKDPRGANILLKILKLFNCPFEKIIYFEIGPFLYEMIQNHQIKCGFFEKTKYVVVETNSLKDELVSIGFENVLIFPNFKPLVNVDITYSSYPKNVLDLVYFSRIEEKKGIYDLIDVLKQINKRGHCLFNLDIYGRFQSPSEKKKLLEICDDAIKYCGALDMGSIDSYYKISKYDLHVFPTKYGEGFPGTLLDFFMAGVPTLSSTFARSSDILTDRDSILFKQGDNKDLHDKLIFIYENQNILIGLKNETLNKKNEFSVERFEMFLNDYLVKEE